MVVTLERVTLLIHHVVLLQDDVATLADYYLGLDVRIDNWGMDLL